MVDDATLQDLHFVSKKYTDLRCVCSKHRAVRIVLGRPSIMSLRPCTAPRQPTPLGGETIPPNATQKKTYSRLGLLWRLEEKIVILGPINADGVPKSD